METLTSLVVSMLSSMLPSRRAMTDSTLSTAAELAGTAWKLAALPSSHFLLAVAFYNSRADASSNALNASMLRTTISGRRDCRKLDSLIVYALR
jgi:hypothetical protein